MRLLEHLRGWLMFRRDGRSKVTEKALEESVAKLDLAVQRHIDTVDRIIEQDYYARELARRRRGD